MTFLLDTNACVVHLRSDGTSALSRRMEKIAPEEVAVSWAVCGELYAGAFKARNPAVEMSKIRNLISLFPSLPFDDRPSFIYGKSAPIWEKRGRKIDSNDLLIAAIALANDLTLVTHNTTEFSRVPGLRLDDWK